MKYSSVLRRLKMKTWIQQLLILNGLLVFGSSCFSQSGFRLAWISEAGLEYNVFRASDTSAAYKLPAELDAIRSGVVYSNELRIRYKQKLRRQSISVESNFNYLYYPEISEARQFQPRLKFLYSYKPKGKHKIYASLSWKRYGSMRIDDQEDEFFIQRSFEKRQAYVRHYYTISKRLKFRANLNYVRSQFMSASNVLQFYNEWTSSVRLDQLLYKRKKEEHRIKLDFEYTLRKNFSSSQESPRRIRNFLSGQIGYELELKKVNFRSGVSATERTEFLDSSLGYRQWELFSKLGLKSKKSELSTRVSYTYRSYKTQYGSIQKSMLMRNKFLRVSTQFRYELRKNLTLIVQAQFIEKTANVFHSSRLFQSYVNGLLSVGFKVDLK